MLKLRRFLKSALKDNEDGAVAIEFALVAIPFFALLFGIIELAITFFLTSALQGAAFDAARNVKTNDVTYADGAEFAQAVCEGLNPGASTAKLETCVSRMEVQVIPMTDFREQDIFGGGDDNSDDADADADDGDEEEEEPHVLVQTNGGETVYIKVNYKYPLILPGKITRLSTRSDENVRDIRTITVHRNEPFGQASDGT